MQFKKNVFTFLLFSLPIVLKANKDENSPSIIIIGAGAAGIAAAAKLFEHGFKNVKILEAENRIGGRIFTTNFSDYLVDLGAQWVHGEEGNVAFEMAWPLGLLEKGNLKYDPQKIIDSSSNTLDQNVVNELYKFLDEIEVGLPEYAKNQRNISIGEFLKNKMDEYLEAHPVLKENEKGLLQFMDLMVVGTHSANTWWNISTSSLIEFNDSPGELLVNWKTRGYSTILDILMKRYPNPEEELPVMNNTILNAEVTLIDYSDKNGKVTVKTKNGETYFADHVIVTCSLGVLKNKHNSLFQPNLSQEKQKTIQALGYGNVAKIFLSFEEPWWINESSKVGFSFIWKDKDLEILQNDSERSWLQGLIEFYTVEHKPRLLAAWIAGKYSVEMEKLSDEQVLNHCIEFLERFLGKSYNITTPTGMIRTNWNSNEHFKGTYSFRSVKTEAENVFPTTLAEPIGETKLVLFAGEATSSHHFSTVNGAIETGWREADRLFKHYPNLGNN